MDMCYAIPGKVLDIKDKIVTVDYFGERKRARNEFHDLAPGDYIYAQGGFVIEKVLPDEALGVLESWQEVFSNLREADLRLAERPKNMYEIANSVRQRNTGNACCVHGIVEFSNHCVQDCLYCGIRKSNSSVKRYRMSADEIVSACDYAVNELNFKALVLQSGEDPYYTGEMLCDIIRKVRQVCATLLVVSVGERGVELYKRLYEAGSRGALLRFETANPGLYGKYRPGKILEDRKRLIKSLKELGYLVMTGFLVGLPGQTDEDIINDIDLTGKLGGEIFSFGPFLPHPGTPLNGAARPKLERALEAIARARISYPDSKILVTSALETLDKDGARRGLLAGANSLMINVTPDRYQRLYEIYPGRAGTGIMVSKRIESAVALLKSLGRAPSDLGL